MGTVSGGSEKSGKTLFDLIAKLFAVSEGYAAGYFMMMEAITDRIKNKMSIIIRMKNDLFIRGHFFCLKQVKIRPFFENQDGSQRNCLSL